MVNNFHRPSELGEQNEVTAHAVIHDQLLIKFLANAY